MPKRLAALTAIVLAAAAFFAAFAYAQSPATSTPQPTPTVAPAPTPTSEQAAAKRRAARAKERAAQKRKAHHLRKRVHHYRKRAWYWQEVMQRRHFRSYGHESRTLNIRYLKRLVRKWRHRYHHAKWQAHHPPRLWAWLCIHRHEGSWTDPNWPYYGGLQMDKTFQKTYNRRLYYKKGTANYWTKWEQIWTAVKAAFRRGRWFYPWPNTARACGLI